MVCQLIWADRELVCAVRDLAAPRGCKRRAGR